MTPEQIEAEFENIRQRNKRVEADKAWETSAVRRIFIAAVTYIVASVWLFVIKDSLPFFKALIPTAGYILSTLSLSFIKNWWIGKHEK